MSTDNQPLPTAVLSDRFNIVNEACCPARNRHTKYRYFSIPALDEHGGPVFATGDDIESNKLLITQPCILVSKLNPRIARVLLIDNIDSIPSCASTEFILYAPRLADLDLRYYRWFFESGEFHGKLQRVAIGSTNSHQRVRPSETLKWQIPAPDVREQQRIADILDSIHIAIRETEALIAKLRKIKAGLLHDLLTRGIDENGELRNPSRVGPQWTDSDIGSVPLGWEVTGLCDRAHPSRPYIKTGPFGSALKSEHWVSEGVPAITIGALGEGEIIRSELLHVTTGKAASLRECAVHDGDLVFSRVADVGRSVLITAASDGWIMSSNLMRISLNPTTVLPEYAYFALVFDDRTRKQVRSLVNAGGRDVANTPILERLKFAWPPLEEQKSIVERANAVDSALRVELDQRSKLTKLKSGLMHDLLTGKVRVPLPGTAR